MFTFTERYTFEWPVKVKFPARDGDIVQEFTGVFVLPDDELEIFAKVDAADATEMVSAVRERLSNWWVGWNGIAVEGGGELPFSPENREKLLRRREIRLAVDAALSEAVLGIREKN